MGAFIIDLDKVGHSLYTKDNDCYNEVIETFSKDILTNGEIDRTKLGEIVFSDINELQKLTEITDKYIYLETKNIIKKVKEENKDLYTCIIVDGALIIDSKIWDILDECILVCAKKSVRIDRLKKRDSRSDVEIEKRISKQKNLYDRKDDFSIIIFNNCQNDNKNIKKMLKDFLTKTI